MERNRNLAWDKMLGTMDMVSELTAKFDIDDEVCLNILSAWIHTIDGVMLARLEEDRNYIKTMDAPDFHLQLGENLLPAGVRWVDFAQLAEVYSGMDEYSVQQVMQALKNKFSELDGQRPFEPIGWIKPSPDGYIAYLWQDFLCPISDDPPEEILPTLCIEAPQQK